MIDFAGSRAVIAPQNFSNDEKLRWLAKHGLTSRVRTMDSQFLRRLRILSVIEGVSTLVLFFIAMPMKYLGGIPEAVTMVGTLHGILFVGLVGAFILAVKRVPIPVGSAFGGVVAAIFPFGPFIFDRHLKKFERQPRESVDR